MASTIYSFRVRPKNSIGYSLSTSTQLDVLSDGVPNFMTPPSYGTITATSIALSWSDLLDETKNGGDNPIYYRLEWEDSITNPSSPTWVEITSESSGKQFSFTHNLGAAFPSASTQKYRLKAKNNIGLGTAYSTELSVPAD